MTPSPTASNPLCRLRETGQSPWLDDISRTMLDDGSLSRLIEEDCIAGLTSNPAIFEHALKESDVYDSAIQALAAEGNELETIYERLVIEDIQRAADLFQPLYRSSERRDGYVSLEVSPHFARDTESTIAEAKRLWEALDRPNAMIKVPGTVEGLPAIRALIADGINVNVTLLFSTERYLAAAEAFVQGLEDRTSSGGEGPLPHSVASFFLSRIDSKVDALLAERAGPNASRLRGRAALALARIAYAAYSKLIKTERWQRLAAKGASPQRLLWASTGTKDPGYSDIKYVEPLVGPDTVTTLPGTTLAAFRDHGRGERTLSSEAREDLASFSGDLGDQDINLARALSELEEEGIEKFVVAFDNLHAALAAKIAATV